MSVDGERKPLPMNNSHVLLANKSMPFCHNSIRPLPPVSSPLEEESNSSISDKYITIGLEYIIPNTAHLKTTDNTFAALFAPYNTDLVPYAISVNTIAINADIAEAARTTIIQMAAVNSLRGGGARPIATSLNIITIINPPYT